MNAVLIVELFLLLLAVLSFIWWRRPSSPFRLRADYTSVAVPLGANDAALHADYIIVGGGPAGIAAARTLLNREPNCDVLLVEAGEDRQPTSLVGAIWRGHQPALCGLLLQCGNVSVPQGAVPGSMRQQRRDCGRVARRPMRPLSATADVLLSYTPYAQGCEVSGTSALGWGVEWPSLWSLCKVPVPADAAWRRPPTRHRHAALHPLAWALAKVMSTLGQEHWMNFTSRTLQGGWSDDDTDAHEAEIQRPFRSSAAAGTVWQPYLYLDIDHHATPLSTALLSGLDPSALRRLRVLCGYRVTSLRCVQPSHSGSSRIDAVHCRRHAWGTTLDVDGDDAAASLRITVGKGVVVAAGLCGSPSLLHRLNAKLGVEIVGETLLHSVRCHDALAVPLLFKAHKGSTLDEEIQSSSSPFHVWRSLLLNATTAVGTTPRVEVISSFPVGASGRIFLLVAPLGGRNAELFWREGIDRILGTYQHAATFLLVLTGVPLSHPIDLITTGEASQLHRRGAFPLSTETPADADSLLYSGVVTDAFLHGMRRCREVARMAPLCHLLQGGGEQEALDYTLLVEDPVKARRLATLMRLPAKKMTPRMKEEVVQLLGWGRKIAVGEAYMRSYVRHHARWLGFGSGSSASFMEESPAADASGACDSFFVQGVSNVVVGDCSAVRFIDGGKTPLNALIAGSIATAVDTGCLAAAQLSSRCMSS